MSGGAPAPAAGAALPMYDWPELAWATDALWRGIAAGLRARGIDAPDALDRRTARTALWRDPALLFSQTCGAPFVDGLEGAVRLIATPIYDAPHCAGPHYASVIVARRTEASAPLRARAGARLAVNSLCSLSGWWAPRRIGLAPERPLLTGAHRLSARAVAQGAADLAAIDAVAFAYLRDVEPDTAQALSVIAVTPPAPALPYITAAARTDAELAALRAALRDALDAPDLASARAALRLRGAARLGPDDYAPLKDWRPEKNLSPL